MYADTRARLSLDVKKTSQAKLRERALERGLSMNQYLKLLVYKELGEKPPAGSSQDDVAQWLRGR